MSPRRLWLQAHRWLALSLGLPLAFVALLGAALTVAKPLDRWAHPTLFHAAGGGPSADGLLAQAMASLRAELGPDTAFTFRPPRERGDTLWVMVRGPWSGTVYVDPASGREVGRRGEHEGAYNLLFELHSALLLEDTGKALVTLFAAAYVVLLASGLVLWWPRRWAGAWRVELQRGPRRAILDAHRVGGAALGLLVGLSVVTGAYMAWRPISGAVTALAGAVPVLPPKVGPVGSLPVRPLDDAVRQAQASFPEGAVGYVQVPSSAAKPIRVRFKLPDDPHPNGLSSVWLHPVSREIMAVHRWDSLDPGARGFSFIYPLHTGALGGIPLKVLNGLLGLTLTGFAVSGLWLWWKRRG